ncbi:unnamed protein product [Mytilus coruscus]|uniref:Uncharacterized protein n=1 Tax=Mytilus coruscus TaxID=42192 RepID=A0A6J8A1E3_MYTCO|nr:unnamed protein product [Mytilus coruscus]
MSLLNSFTAVKSLFNSFNATILFNGNNESSEQNSENESISLDLSAENVPDFLQISPKKNSVTIHVAQHMLQDVQRILDSDLNSIKSHFQFGNIYKTVNNSVTVTLYIINDLESKLENKCSDVSIQTDSIECQTAKFVNTCDVSTQTAPIPAPRLSKLKLNKEPCQTVETTTQPENQIHNLKHVKSNKTQNSEQSSSDKNLIIGSSILKGIRPSGLSKTDIRTFRGANINRITSEIMKMNLTTYKNIILQVGGNDISAGKSLKELEEDFESLIWAARSCCNKDCNIIVSGLPPRYDSTFSISQEYGISKRNKKGSVNYVIIEGKVNGNYSFDTTKKVSISKRKSINDALITSNNADTLSQTCGQDTLIDDKQLDTNCVMSNNDSNVIIACDLLYSFPEANFLIDVKLSYIYVFTLAIAICMYYLIILENHALTWKQLDPGDNIFGTYGFSKSKGIRICSHNVNRIESKYDEIKHTLMFSKTHLM